MRSEPLRRIAAAHGLSESALHGHEAAHLPATLVTAEDARHAASADALLAESLALQEKALELMARAEAEGDVRAAVVALKEARGCLEFRVRIGVELLGSDGREEERGRVADFAHGARDEVTRKLKALAERLPTQSGRPGEGASNP